MKQREGAKGKGWLSRVLLALVLILAIGIGITSLYFVVTERVIDLSIQSMDELALHDEVAIIKSLEYRWNMLAGVGMECRQAKCDTIRELLELLHQKEGSTGGVDLALRDEEGNLYYGALFIRKEETVEALCQNGESRFIARNDDRGVSASTNREALLFGIEIKPFTVEGKTFTHVLCRFTLESLSSELKIDSYGGKGYSSVIDRDGNYIVNINQSHNLRKQDNFFTEIAQYHLDSGTTINEIQERIAMDESFTIYFETERGRELMHFNPMTDDLDWYFVITAPRSVFEAQSMGILRIVLLIFVAMGTAVMLVLLLVLHSRQSAAQARLEQLHKEELREALDLAKQANRAKTVFLNNMSHDIRTPMNAIIGFTNLASTHIDNTAQVKDYLTKIGQASNHLLSLINDVLDMSRIESGKMTIDEKPENLAEIIQNIRNIIQTDIETRRLELKVDIVNLTDENVCCDKLRLNQVLLNLLSNAMKFTPAGGVVSLRLMEKEGSRAGWGDYEIRVKDTGIGMSKEFAATIFEPFTREQTATVSGIQGTGLGMSITKNLVDMMNGTITVRTKQGKGTEFVISLSFRLLDGAEETSEQPQEDPREEKEVSFEGRRLLLVEDNELNREIAIEILQDSGFLIEIAENGRDAVEAVKRSYPGYFDAVLMDVQMPVMNGYEATQAIRKLEDPALAEILIIAMTANAFEEDRQTALDVGMDAHVGKPLDIPVLLDTLRMFLL